MAWKDLNVRDRAGFIRQMVSLGITKSKDQENFFNSSIEGPGKRQTFNPTKPKYTTQKTVGYQKVPLEGYQLDKYNEMMDQQVDNIMNATGADYETAFKISGYDPYKYVPIKHNFIKKANGGHLFDGDPAAQITLPTVVKGGKPSIFSRGWWGKQADRLDNIAFGAGFIRQMVKLGINTPLEQENSYNYALGGKPRRIYNDKAKEYNHGINNYQQSWAGTYGNNNQPFITEKVYTTGPQWKQQNPSTQVITEEYYNKKYNEGILPIVSAFLGKDPRLEKKVVQKNRYDAYNNPISSVTRTVDYTQPFGQRRTAQRTEFGNSIGPRMNYVQKSLSENSRNIMENQQILNNAQSLIRGYGYGMKDKGGHLFDGESDTINVVGRTGIYNTYLEGQNLGQTAVEKYKVNDNNKDFHTYNFNSPYGNQEVYAMPSIDNQPATIYGTDFNYNEKDNPREYEYYLNWLNSLQNDKTLTYPTQQLPLITITQK